MTFRLAASPLDSRVAGPVERHGGFPEALLEAIVPTAATEAVRERLREPGALVVTTGQQPGLLLGPAYGLYKAVSAAAVARVLEERWQRPVVPIFWSAGDDHDWDEARRVHWRDRGGAIVARALPPRDAGQEALPASSVRLGSDWEALLAGFLRDTSSYEWGGWVAATVAEAYAPGQTLGQAYLAGMASVLGSFGILVLDSTHVAVKRAMRSSLDAALEQHERLARAIAERDATLRQQGHDAGVTLDAAASLVMMMGDAGRDRVMREGRHWRLRRSGEHWRDEELRRQLAGMPELFSPNVLLRPVVESAILPTVAYCAGPGELRYLELAAVVFAALGVPRPAAVPRWSGTVIDAHVDRTLEKFDLDLAEILDPSEDVLAHVAAEHMPGDAAVALDAARRAVSENLDVLATEGGAIAEPLLRSAEGSARKMLFELDRLERRFVRVLKRRHADELRQLSRAETAVRPLGKPQERILSGADLLARHGPPLLEAIVADMTRSFREALEAHPVSP